MLRDKGIDSMYPTTVAKVESGERAVRMVEAAAFADLFGVSVDWLLGRDIGLQQDLVFTLQAASQTAQQAAPLVTSIEAGLRDRVGELRMFEFEERDAITAESSGQPPRWPRPGPRLRNSGRHCATPSWQPTLPKSTGPD